MSYTSSDIAEMTQKFTAYVGGFDLSAVVSLLQHRNMARLEEIGEG